MISSVRSSPSRNFSDCRRGCDWDYLRYRSKINVSLASVLIKRRAVVITDILIIALHNYRAHRFAICTRFARPPHFPRNRMLEKKSSGLMQLTLKLSIGEKQRGQERGGEFFYSPSSTKFFNDLVANLGFSFPRGIIFLKPHPSFTYLHKYYNEETTVCIRFSVTFCMYNASQTRRAYRLIEKQIG